MVMLTWRCCFKEAAITGVTSKLLTSEFVTCVNDDSEYK